MMAIKHILLLGAGKSATVLIQYLKKVVQEKDWMLTVADHDLPTVLDKLGNPHPHCAAVQLDILDEPTRRSLIQKADVVISLMPPALHYHVACDCLTLHKHLLTASYVDDRIKAMSQDIADKGLLFLCEMGLDPGIDHMSAMDIIHRLKQQGAVIQHFYSHCGGLVAPESDNNPWHYKISWNPRNVVLAGKSGAIFQRDGQAIMIPYEEVFDKAGKVVVDGIGELAYYPNRNSLEYIPTYGLQGIHDFLRTTLRYPSFCSGWQRIVSLRLTDDQVQYDTDGMNLQDLLQAHFHHQGLAVSPDRLALDELQKELFHFIQLDQPLPLNQGLRTMADILQWLIERAWVLVPGDKDMVVMLHELIYTDQTGTTRKLSSSLVVLGEDEKRTAMAKTVGLPLGIASVLLLEGMIDVRGLQIPIVPAIYQPVLAKLRAEGIIFNEKEE